MDVLAVERCDEGPIDTIDDVVGQIVGFVFQSFDRRDFGIKMGRIAVTLASRLVGSWNIS